MLNNEAEQDWAMTADPGNSRGGPGLWAWCREGLRAGLGMRPRTGDHQPTPVQVGAILLMLMFLFGGLGRLEVVGPATLNLRGWLTPWWSTSLLLLLAWWALPHAPSRHPNGPIPLTGLASWFVLSSLAVVPVGLLAWSGYIVQVRMGLGVGPVSHWGLFLLQWLLLAVVVLILIRRFGVRKSRLFFFAVGWILVSALSLWQFNDRPWWYDSSSDDEEDRPRLVLNQEAFEKQQQIWGQALADLAPNRSDVAEVYGLVFAPYAAEDVFMRESQMVAAVLAQRFDAQGRVLQLVNHATTLDTHPWATKLNLERAIQALGQRMDRERDVLVLYLTSHGASNFKLAATHWPLKVDPLSPEALRAMLDRAGIRNRVIAISACYSGGWIGPLAGDNTLIMTAANAERTSYGCGRQSELTYFGRAVFDEQLRKTHSFEQAFAAARVIIDEREKQAGKKDGYSDPQISVGSSIKSVLAGLEKRLANTAPLPATTTLP